MDSDESSSINELRNQLSIARKEIQNLRKQVRSLSFAHQTDLKNIKDLLKDFKCANCKGNPETAANSLNDSTSTTVGVNDNGSNTIHLKPIGVIRTQFAQKRAIPRQPMLGPKLSGCIEIVKDIFNNPEHSLEGLTEFSHLWIIYHFHKNESHTKAKVAPPRLSGERIGIFSTRSPHRPCPIGLSLVQIDRIEGKSIYFNGTDMVDGTPVLDIKPYIPYYDSPSNATNIELLSYAPDDREEPEGEETCDGAVSQSTSTLNHLRPTATKHAQLNGNQSGEVEEAAVTQVLVRVPNWVKTESYLKVLFNEWAEKQINDLQLNKTNIIDVLKTDPRSVYLRTRYGSQIFTFQLGEVTVTCKFDDINSTVTVVQCRKSENLSSADN